MISNISYRHSFAAILALILFIAPAEAAWVNCDDQSLWVEDTGGIEQDEISVQYSGTGHLVFRDAQTGKVDFCIPVGPGWQLVGFRALPGTDKSRQATTVFEIKGGGEHRYFNARNGQEVRLAMDDDKGIVVKDPLPAEEEGTPVPVLQSWGGANSRITSPEYHLVRNRKDWKDIWERHIGEGVPIPDVAFGFNMVIAIFAGEEINSEGVAVMAVKETADAIRFDYYQPLFHIADQNITTQPFGIFVIPASSKRVVLRENRTRQNSGVLDLQVRQEFGGRP